MQDFLLSLLPWTKREWSDFLADLTPLFGLFIFASEPRNIMIALYPELYFVFGYGMLRLISTAIYAAIQQGKESSLLDLDIPEPIIGKIFYFIFVPFFGVILMIALLCIVTLLIGFNFFFYMMIELFLSVATTGGLETNFNFLTLYNSLEPKEQYYIWGIFLFTLYRYVPKIYEFFKTQIYKNYKDSWSWVALGTPKIPKHNQFQKMTNAFRTMFGKENQPSDFWEYTPIFYIGFLFFYFGVLVLMIKYPLFGPIITLVIKAFVEMYFFRLHKEAQGIVA
ncbi:hypothetical protein EHQ16_08445 [Leptospira kanakyensis]|uniref:Uncharacterized protein n=1 Tax=Leptospira kanakyensis TaxID=2484968 RepID=A0A6N4Q820_9LEPT|nr:hypothetical protein [Leptospira kanakyensis]TGK55379.1 hypothetical protein EHQ11_00620 [Leptospira kanakyensis]TGK60913.1 hypothetical protein EHQ16_08445 [Leptospira kanakyensis]TGK76612.1 hypothetical protein EHQ18_01205 [Leptospira kanakyensis]